MILPSLLIGLSLQGCLFMRPYDTPLPLSDAAVDQQGRTRLDSPAWRIEGQSVPADNRIALTYTVGPDGMQKGDALKISLGHLLPTDQRIYTPFSLTATSAFFFHINLLQDVAVSASGEGARLRVHEPRPGHSLKQMFRYIKYKRSKEGQINRDNLLRQIDNEFAVLVKLRRGELKAGDTVRIEIGHRAGLEAPHREAELEVITRLDGDGDGRFGVVPDPPSLVVYSATPSSVRLIAPSVLWPDESARLVIRVEDDFFLPNLAHFDQGTVKLDPVEGLAFPTELALQTGDQPWDGTLTTLRVLATAEGLYRITGTATLDGRSFPIRSNPIRVAPQGEPHVYFGDLHTHSVLSYDADRPPAYVWARQRDQERHDFAALTDHDMIGSVPFAPKTGIAGRTPDEWAYAQRLADEADQPGEFVTIKAYEWTSYYYGHRNLFFSPALEQPPLLHHNLASAGEKPDEQTPGELIDGLGAALDYIAIPHSTAWPTGGLNYTWGPGTPAHDHGHFGDPDAWPQQRLIELYSTHGTSEFHDNPYAVDKGHPEAPTDSKLVRKLLSYDIQQAPADSGNFTQDALGAGWKLGFIGSSDMHYLSHIDQAYKYGFAAVSAPGLTREDIWAGLKSRQTYATTGVRILLDLDVDGAAMGGVVALGERRQVPLRAEVNGTDALARVELVQYDGAAWAVVWSGDPQGALDFTVDQPTLAVKPGDVLYLRVAQKDGNMAWASPVWFTD